MKAGSIAIAILALSVTSSGLAQAPKQSDALGDLQSKVKLLESFVDLLSSRVRLLELSVHASAEFDAESSGYQRVDTPMGSVLVRFVGIANQGGAPRVELELGNVLAVEFFGAELNLEWGPVSTDPFERLAIGLKGRQQKCFAEMPKPGSSKKVQCILAGAAPDDVGFLRVSVYPMLAPAAK